MSDAQHVGRTFKSWGSRRLESTPHRCGATRSAGGVMVAQLRRQPRLAHVVVAVQRGKAQQAGGDAHGGEARVAGLPRAVCGGCRERPAVVHGRADHEACRHTIVEQVNTAFRRMGLIFPLEAEGDNPDWATLWLTGVGVPATA
jgi:hypothetical protein